MRIRKQKTKATAYTTQNKARLVRGGKDYFNQLIEMINQATHTIHLQTYIFEADETGREVTDALKTAVTRKVQVYLMADGYASKALSKEFIQELADAGIHFRFFEPILRNRNFYFGRRLHHKLVVTDNRFSLVGGVNISNKYNDRPGQPAWLDFAIYAEGTISSELCLLSWKTWKGSPSTRNTGIKDCTDHKPDIQISSEQNSLIRMRRNDWVFRKNQISRTYKEIFFTATSQVTILCSYFIPGYPMRKYLLHAVRKGVKVRLVLAGLSDVVLSKNAERFMYDWLLRHNVEIYEYQKNVLHGKIAVCDGEWMTVGSYNINDLSAYASIELNLDIKNQALAAETDQVLQTIINNDCVQVTSENHRRARNLFVQLGRWLSYQCIRLTLFLFTFYFKQQG